MGTRRSDHEGTIVQRKSGTWQASLQVHGTRKTVYGKTRHQAALKLGKLKRQAIENGALPDAGTHTVNDLLDRWLETVKSDLKPRTIESYRQTTRLYVRPHLGDTRLERLTPDKIQRCYTALQAKGLKRAPSKAHSVLHRALELAVMWGWLAQNPSDRVIKPQYSPERKEMWNAWELNAFLKGTREHWLYPAWVVLIVSGVRSGELRALRWENVDLDAGTITIARTLQRIEGEWKTTPPKTGAGVRTITLPKDGIDAIRLQQERQEASAGWVFTNQGGDPLAGAILCRQLKKECKRLGIRPLTPHELRHLHASLLLKEGLPVPVVSQRLGHANPNITLSVYAHVVGEQDKEAARMIGDVICEMSQG